MKVETKPGRGSSQDSSHEPTESPEKLSATLPPSRTGGTNGNLEEVFFIDGSRYQGTWDALGMAGFGSFRMPHGVIYEGHIEDGMYQGEGRLEWPGKQVIHGVWNRGEMIEWRYTFADGLSYHPENWTYCRFPDRRFNRSIKSGLKPAGKSLETEDQPTKVIPPGCYDSGDGVFDPSTLCVTNFEKPSKVIRIPKRDEIEWITSHCRKGRSEPVGYRPELNENWSSDAPELPYRLPMSTDSPERWWRRIFTFERDTSVSHDQLASRPLNDGMNELSTTTSSAAECRCETEAAFDVCGDRSSEDSSSSSSSASEVYRRVICEAMSSDDYEGEQVEDLLMTVCVPPTGTYTVIRRKPRAAKSFDTPVEAVEVESSEEDTQEVDEEEEAKEERPEEESERRWEEEEEEELERDVIESFEGSPEESIPGEDDSVSSLRAKVFGKEAEVKSVEEIERMRIPEREKRTKVVRRVVPKKQKKKSKSTVTKQRCPSVIDEDQLLQRKVGDLLFSPALEAPRSPVHLVRKECDREICTRSKPPKYDSSKCGVSQNVSHKARRRKLKTCTDAKTTKSVEKSKICLPSKLFVTTDDV